MLKTLYWYQIAEVKIELRTSEAIDLKQHIKQGCMIHYTIPSLFHLDSKAIFKKVLDDLDDGIIINRIPINNVRYKDDMVILTDCI